MNDYLAIIIGLLSSLLASLMFLYFLNTQRPKIIISEQIAKSHNIDGHVEYQIKTINKTRRSITNIQAQLFLTTPTEIRGGILEKNDEIQLRTKNLHEMAKFNRKDKTAKYVFRFICEEDIEKKWNENSFLRFKISASHSLSGLISVFSKDYQTKEKSIKEGEFEFGKSLKIKQY